MQQIGFIVVLIVAIFIAIFAIQNGAPVDVDLFFVTFETPLAVVMMTCIIIGAVLILLLDTTRQIKKRSESKELKNKLKTLEGDKILAETKLIEVETELKSLRENNDTLTAKISELEEKNKMQNETIEKLNKELGSSIDTIAMKPNTTDEGTETEISDEKSEA